MKKSQAEQYYEQLKKLDRADTMELAEVINILTSDSISVKKIKTFLFQVSSNQFGQYSQIYQYVEKQDWKQLAFSDIYKILKCLKSYLVKNKSLKDNKQNQSRSREAKDSIISFQEKSHNKTLESIVQQFNITEELANTSQNQESVYQSKGKQMKIKLIKKLLIIFDHFRKLMFTQKQTFDKNQQIIKKFDLTTFMKYIKTFDIGFVFKPQKIIKCFKQNAINTIWLDFDRFVDTNFSMIKLKGDLTHKEKYLRLRGLGDILSTEKIKSMLNIRGKNAVATIAEGHTGTYRQDILQFLQQKRSQRKEKQKKKWSGKKVKTEGSEPRIMLNQNQRNASSVTKSKSVKFLSSRLKHTQNKSIYQQLKLPKLRVKQQRQQSIYKTLKKLDLSDQKQKIKQLINFEQNEQFLSQYLKKEHDQQQKRKKKPKKLFQLPSMRFT